MKNTEVLHYKSVWLFSIFAALFMLATSGAAFAQATATIGGSLFTGEQWTPPSVYAWSPKLTGIDAASGVPDGGNAAINNDGTRQVEVMVQNLDTGDFVDYGIVASGTNTWSLDVAAPGNYLAMFMADGHDATSREYHVLPGTITMTQNAYLPPASIPNANLLVYAFKDNYVNSEDDYPMDFALKSVKFTVKNDKGVVVKTGISGTQTLADMPVGAGPDINGLYFFTGLEPGNYEVTAEILSDVMISDPTTGALVAPTACEAPPCNSSSQWYQISSSEGTKVEEISLYPGDPGTAAGGYMVWFAFVDKLGQNTTSSTTGTPGSISGTLYDGDGIVGLAAAGLDPALFIPDPINKPWQSVVTINDRAPNGLLVLYPNIQTIGVVKPIATTEANPDGTYTFTNVPPGNYVIFATDLPLDYVWVQTQATVTPGANLTMVDLLPMRWYARTLGTVTSTATTTTTTTTITTDPITGAPVIDPTTNLPVTITTTTSTTTTTPVPNAKVTMRIEDGTIWKETVTDAFGKYLFDELPEVEVVGTVSVEPPAGYRAVVDTVNNYDLSSRTIQWYTMNYQADLQLEPIPATEGVIRGFVHNDNWELNPVTHVWSTGGLYDEKEEKTFDGVTVELLDAAGNPVPALDALGNPVLDTLGNPVYVTATTGGVNRDGLLSQHWIPPYTFAPPYFDSFLNMLVGGIPDEIGGVFKGTTVGQYEFRGLAPGDYQVRVVVPNGFSPVEPGGVKTVVALGGGSSVKADLGIKTRVPLAGEIEGGIFDDFNLDNNIWSGLYGEKAGVPGAPLGVYDHLGYFLGSAIMSRCYAGSTVCTACPEDPALVDPVTGISTGRFAPGTLGCPDVAVEAPEVGIRVVSGPHIFVGNDPAFPGAGGYDPSFDPLPWTYNFRQGSNKFEADWSLLSTAMANADGGAMIGGPLGNDLIKPQNQPIIVSVTPVASAAPQGSTAVAQSGYFNMLALNNAGTLTDAGSFQLALLTATTPAPAPVVLSITGSNFGAAQGYSTVTLSGVKLAVKSWSSNNIVVTVPVDAIRGALVVATSTGISNAIYPSLGYSTTMAANMASRSVFVNANATGLGNGSEASPYKTIAKALDNLPAVPGVRYVFVQPGTYNERVQIKQSNVALVGSGAHETTINANMPLTISSKGVTSGGPAIFIGKGGIAGALTKVTVSGFTIKGGSSGDESGGGIFGDFGNTSLDINTSIITRNRGEYGGGIWLHKSNHNVNIWSNVIAANGAVGGYGGGISVNDEPGYGSAILYGANEHLMDDAAYPVLTTSYNIYNNLVIYNASPDYGGGMSLYEAKDRLNIFGNVIMENKSYDHGGGIFFEDCGPVDLSGNVFMHNYAMDDGGAVSFEDVGDNASIVRVYNNLFAENIADDNGENTARGGALSFDDTLRAEVFNNTIVGNIVAGSNNPRGGAIDSERHGHEYMNLSPAFSNVKIQNNIIWNNWRLNYDRVHTRGNGFGGHDYKMGTHYVWTQDNLHVDNPAVQGEYASQNNSESFTVVNYNDISDGSYAGRTGNMNVNPGFVNPSVYNWRLAPGSPVANKAPATTSPLQDLERNRRLATGGFVEMGAYELLSPQPSIVMIPKIRNIIVMPKHN